ncbi:MAG: haloacid dehalogenase type II [Halofilum sp. (in: g-proteobacteria)]|nr:haloacid dehalogenase type II [Halofilum sp. (in: g-proteobacteria)]
MLPIGRPSRTLEPGEKRDRMMQVIGFDVFGTLVDPAGVAEAVRPHAGDATPAFIAEWRRSQLEYAFRRAAMNQYAPFDAVTADALTHAATMTGVEIPDDAREELVGAWTRLPAFPEAAGAIDELRAAGHRCVAFSNGTPAGLDRLLRHNGLHAHLDEILSVEAVGTYKPAPAVYQYLVERGGAGADATWLVSGNPWDVIGARAAGLRAAWVQRDPERTYDPWGDSPDLVVHDLAQLAAHPAFNGAND